LVTKNPANSLQGAGASAVGRAEGFAKSQGCQADSHMRREPGREVGRACDSPDCQHKYMLRHTLADVIEALEATRKSFKSRQIEMLRKKLTKVLIEEA